MTPSAGETWLADSPDEIRRLVVVISDSRLHTLAGRAIVAPVVVSPRAPAPPWYVSLGNDESIAVHLLAGIDVDRLLERTSIVSYEVLRSARQVVAALAT